MKVLGSVPTIVVISDAPPRAWSVVDAGGTVRVHKALGPVEDACRVLEPEHIAVQGDGGPVLDRRRVPEHDIGVAANVARIDVRGRPYSAQAPRLVEQILVDLDVGIA